MLPAVPLLCACQAGFQPWGLGQSRAFGSAVFLVLIVLHGLKDSSKALTSVSAY